eukprot:190633-Rhodomonas_salina.3
MAVPGSHEGDCGREMVAQHVLHQHGTSRSSRTDLAYIYHDLNPELIPRVYAVTFGFGVCELGYLSLMV